jgi:hypothetical protein
MTVGKIIESEDYNKIRNKIIAVLGSGGTNPNTLVADPTFGYGQTPQSSAINTGTKITKAQWDALRWDIYNSLFHQTGTVPGLTTIAASSKIQATILDYESFADTAITNRLNFGSTAIEGGTPTTGATTSRTFSWSTTVSSTVTVTFANSNDARYFFNTGGTIRFSTSFVKTLNNSQNISWETLLSGVGTQTFNQARFYALTNTYGTPWYTTSASFPYGSNTFRISARSNVANNSNGTASQIEFLAQWIDGYVDPGNNPGDVPNTSDLVQGTLSLTANQTRAVTVLQPFGTTFGISGPSSYTVTSIA